MGWVVVTLSKLSYLEVAVKLSNYITPIYRNFEYAKERDNDGGTICHSVASKISEYAVQSFGSLDQHVNMFTVLFTGLNAA